MTRRLTPLPHEGRKANIESLIAQRKALLAARKSTAIVDRKLRIARAWQIRQEVRAAS
jgi:hypothetical protein